MNKSELLAALASKYAAVATEKKHNTVADITYYTVDVLDVVGEACRSAKVPFFVKDDDLPGEEAYWGGAEPKPSPPDPTWGDTCRAWLRTKVADDAILLFSNLAPDNVEERATVTVVIDVGGTWIEKRYAVWQNVSDVWQFEPLA